MESDLILADQPLDHRARLERLWAALDADGMDLLFLPAGASDLEHLTGLPRRAPSFGEIGYANHWISGALITPGAEPLFVLTKHFQDFDLTEPVAGEVVTARDSDDGAALFKDAVESVAPGARMVGVSGRAWAETTLALGGLLPSAKVVVADPLLEGLRRVKDAQEIALMRRAAAISDRALAEVTTLVQTGATEVDIAAAVDLSMRLQGSPGPSFDTGVWAMGPGIARDASERVSTAPLPEGSAVSFDFGAIFRGYCNDFGRTLHLGNPSAEYVEVHRVVMDAQEAARERARPGVAARDVHLAARKVIDDAGYGDGFRHRTGHCIGLDVHEHPYISEEDTTELEPGMLFTIEPSVFLPGRVGVRVEDVFLMTEDGAESINQTSHEMVCR
ncbi:M24 family metallopeptidase [Demequina sp. NBRC 110054]|uniref:M24 family metallopeptidase n=1 Tax=Demequina sp. NBRC 110054 TaxID=1570343 RepID=UPI000A06BA4A|nr:M24 family metallopeptidase [Demequina sp. NBRC 110054]